MVEITVVKIDSSLSKCMSLAIENVYANIGRQIYSSHINQYLRSIIWYEMETLNIIKEMKNEDIWSNIILRDHLLSRGCRRKESVINITIGDSKNIFSDLLSILEMDDEFLTSDKYINLRAHIISDNGLYLGHLYTWESDDILYVDAIRSSTENILDRSRGEGIKGIVAMLVDSSIKLARLVDMDTVVVREPYPITKHVLSSMGFDYNIFNVGTSISSKIPKYRLIILTE